MPSLYPLREYGLSGVMELDIPADLLNHYTVQHGRITTPGRYQGSPAYTPMFHAFWIDGLADQMDGDTALFWLGDDDFAMFPELARFTIVALFVTESGHVAAHPLAHTDEPN